MNSIFEAERFYTFILNAKRTAVYTVNTYIHTKTIHGFLESAARRGQTGTHSNDDLEE